MKRKLFTLCLLAPTFFINAQNVGIGTTTPDLSAKLEVSSTTQGMLVPRMNSIQRTSISSPATGLLVFDTDTKSFWYFVSVVGWSNLSTGAAGWQLPGNTGTDTSFNFIGTIDNNPLKFKVNNQRAGLIGVNGNIFWGPGSGFSTPGPTDNIAIGANSLTKNISSEIIAIGTYALNKNTSGQYNTATGPHALENNTTGNYNTAFGSYNLASQITGTGNTAIGFSVLGNHKRGSLNTAIGINAMFSDTSGNDNATLGYFGLFNNLSGNKNTAVGNLSLFANKTGSNNLGLGYQADVLYDSLQNASVIGALARVDCSNCMVLGSVNGVNGASSNVNVGIGINNPTRPLSFPAFIGKKISLYPGASGDAGFGVFGNELRIHSDYASANITFGYDNYSSGFTERMRIINSGGSGMDLNGRLTLKNGTSPLDPNYGPGIWLSKPDNSNLLGFMGTQNNQNIGFYGGPAGWGFTYDAVNSRVGIGNNNPAYLLDVSGNSLRTGNFVNTNTSGLGIGVYGSCRNNPTNGYGVYGEAGYTGVYGEANLVGAGNRRGSFGIAYNGENNYGVTGFGTGGAFACGIYGSANGATTNWAGYFAGDVYANFFSTSDRKLKKDIEPLNGALSIINQLNPSFYTFKTTEYKQLHLPEGIHYGLIADEVQLIMPGIVKKAVEPAQFENNDEHNGKKLSDKIEFNTINYTEMIPILIAAMKEQQVMIEELKIKNQMIGQQQLQIDKQQQQIDDLKKMVEKLVKQ